MDEQSSAEERGNTALCDCLLGTKAETVLVKSPGPFPFPFHYYFFIHICFSALSTVDYSFYSPYLDPCLVWRPRSLKLSEFPFFIGLETSHRRGPEKHSTKNTIKSIIRGMFTGVNFLQLWGEERALRLRTRGSHWPMILSICSVRVKPQ